MGRVRRLAGRLTAVAPDRDGCRMVRVCMSLVGHISELVNSTVPSNCWNNRLLRMPVGPVEISVIPCWQWPTSGVAEGDAARQSLASAERTIGQWNQGDGGPPRGRTAAALVRLD